MGYTGIRREKHHGIPLRGGVKEWNGFCISLIQTRVRLCGRTRNARSTGHVEEIFGGKRRGCHTSVGVVVLNDVRGLRCCETDERGLKITLRYYQILV